MTAEERVKHLEIRCANLEENSRKDYPLTVRRARNEKMIEIIELFATHKDATGDLCFFGAAVFLNRLYKKENGDESSGN